VHRTALSPQGRAKKNMAELEARVIEDLLTSDNSDNDDEGDVIFLHNLVRLRQDIPRVRNYIRTVVDLYNDNQVNINV